MTNLLTLCFQILQNCSQILQNPRGSKNSRHAANQTSLIITAETTPIVLTKENNFAQSILPFLWPSIPETVGKATKSIWKKLSNEMKGATQFRIWPFDGKITDVNHDSNLTFAEVYPAITYAIAIADHLPTPRILITKKKLNCRLAAVKRLTNSQWVKRFDVKIRGLETAISDDNYFDSLLACAAKLRCLLENKDLENSQWDDPVCEGGMLLSKWINFDSKSVKF